MPKRAFRRFGGRLIDDPGDAEGGIRVVRPDPALPRSTPQEDPLPVGGDLKDILRYGTDDAVTALIARSDRRTFDHEMAQIARTRLATLDSSNPGPLTLARAHDILALSVIVAVGDSDSTALSDVVRRLLVQSEAGCRSAAIRTIVSLGEEMSPDLRLLLRSSILDPNVLVFSAGAATLAQNDMDRPAIIERCRGLLSSAQLTERSIGVAVLIELDSASARALLSSQAEVEVDSGLAVSIAASLSPALSEDLTQRIAVKALSHESPSVRSGAISLLSQVASRAQIVQEALADEPDELLRAKLRDLVASSQ